MWSFLSVRSNLRSDSEMLKEKLVRVGFNLREGVEGHDRSCRQARSYRRAILDPTRASCQHKALHIQQQETVVQCQRRGDISLPGESQL